MAWNPLKQIGDAIVGGIDDLLGTDFYETEAEKEEKEQAEAKATAINTNEKAVDALKTVDEQMKEASDFAGRQANAAISSAQRAAKDTVLQGGGSKLAAALAGAQAAGDAGSTGYVDGLKTGMDASAQEGINRANAIQGITDTTLQYDTLAQQKDTADKNLDAQYTSSLVQGLSALSDKKVKKYFVRGM